jgi:hypothetical protein
MCRGSNKALLAAHLTQLSIALRKETREAARKGEVARKALCEMHALQTVSNEHDISKFVSYEALSSSYRAFVASL